MSTSLSQRVRRVMTPRDERAEAVPPAIDLPTLCIVGPGVPNAADILRQIEVETEEIVRLNAAASDPTLAEDGIVWPAKQRDARIAKRAALQKMLDLRNRADAHLKRAERLFEETRARVDEHLRYQALRELLGEPATRALAEPATPVESLRSIYLAQLELATWADNTRRPTLAAEARARCEALAERIRERATPR